MKRENAVRYFRREDKWESHWRRERQFIFGRAEEKEPHFVRRFAALPASSQRTNMK
jgi:hypothetical protein